jgi:hypothetical protein
LSSGADHVLPWESFSQRVCHIQIRVYFANLYITILDIDGWRVVDDDDYRQAVGEPQAEGVMSTAASFSLS